MSEKRYMHNCGSQELRIRTDYNLPSQSDDVYFYVKDWRGRPTQVFVCPACGRDLKMADVYEVVES